ncbi:MAG: hypothetical protein HKN41_01345, partial [Ilumatobacter sp.]|nr:hypothetical protein [Ilumatobacter sp.]
NVTAVAPSAAGFLTVFPCGTDQPLASNVNYVAGDIVPNAALAKIGTDGKVCIYTSAEADIVVDVNGFVPLGGSPESLDPARILETRSGPENETVDGQFEGVGRIEAGDTLTLKVAGRGGVPGNADGVFLNVTAVTPGAAGFLTVYPCNAGRPLASNVNYVAGDVVPNVVLAQLSPTGQVCIYSSAASHVVVDVNGYVPEGRTPGTVVPARILETRIGTGLDTVDGLFEGIGRRGAGSTLELTVAGRGGVPAEASAVFLNVTAVAPDAAGFVTVFPCGEDRPNASNVNYFAGDVAPNSVLAKIGDGGKVCLYTLAATDLVVDVAGEVPQPSIKGLVDASAGTGHACALDDEGGVTCWGEYWNGELGVGDIDIPGTNSSLPVTIPDFSATKVEASERFTCAVRTNGSAACWGRNIEGQVGDGTTTERLSPTDVSGLTNVIDVTTGLKHACALRSNGEIWCWGDNGAGQLGDGSNDDSLVPVQVTGLPGGKQATAIDGGREYTCALMDDGTGVCWGRNSNGQLGDPGGTSNTPVVVGGLADAVELEAGQNHTCARIDDGTVECWGRLNDLGNGDQGPGSTSTPETVAGLAGVVDISVGSIATCAALDDGTARCWGQNTSGMVGNGTIGGDPELTPIQVVGIEGDVLKVHVSGNGRFSCATLADTTVVCWGDNSDKELGSLSPGVDPRADSAVPLVVG